MLNLQIHNADASLTAHKTTFNDAVTYYFRNVVVGRAMFIALDKRNRERERETDRQTEKKKKERKNTKESEKENGQNQDEEILLSLLCNNCSRCSGQHIVVYRLG